MCHSLLYPNPANTVCRVYENKPFYLSNCVQLVVAFYATLDKDDMLYLNWIWVILHTIVVYDPVINQALIL